MVLVHLAANARHGRIWSTECFKCLKLWHKTDHIHFMDRVKPLLCLLGAWKETSSLSSLIVESLARVVVVEVQVLPEATHLPRVE